MDFILMTTPQSPYFPRSLELYEAAFPREERRDLTEHLRVMGDPRFRCCAVLDRGRQVGIVFYWEAPDFLYLEHLCIDPACRGSGYGTGILSHLKTLDKPIYLEIELPVDALTRNRLHFYRRSGFCPNDHRHIQAKYRRGDPDLQMLVLSDGRPITPAEYAVFRDFLDRFVQIPQA